MASKCCSAASRGAAAPSPAISAAFIVSPCRHAAAAPPLDAAESSLLSKSASWGHPIFLRCKPGGLRGASRRRIKLIGVVQSPRVAGRWRRPRCHRLGESHWPGPPRPSATQCGQHATQLRLVHGGAYAHCQAVRQHGLDASRRATGQRGSGCGRRHRWCRTRTISVRMGDDRHEVRQSSPQPPEATLHHLPTPIVDQATADACRRAAAIGEPLGISLSRTV